MSGHDGPEVDYGGGEVCGGGVEYLVRGDGEFAELEAVVGGIGDGFVRHVVATATRTK